MLEKVRALLAKAQELIARHAIDEAMVSGAAVTADSPDAPTGVRLPVDDPYAGAKFTLLSEVAVANRCHAVWSKGLEVQHGDGLRRRPSVVEMLYTSLLV